MKEKTVKFYVCEYCGEEFTHYETCELHEDECVRKETIVTVTLHYNGSFKLNTRIERAWHNDGTAMDIVLGKDDDCNYFYISSKDTSDTHIKEMKSKLIREAIEWTEHVRTEGLMYTMELLQKLRKNEILDEPYSKADTK